MKPLSLSEAQAKISSLNPNRVVLIHPTKFLGNLLISGNLIQQYAAYCRERGISLMLVLDNQFEALLQNQLPRHCQVLWYPRRQLGSRSFLGKIRCFLSFLGRLRTFRADLAFNLEDDAVASHLLRFSGARFRLGSSAARGAYGLSGYLEVEVNQRNPGEAHRWYSYREVFAGLGADVTKSPLYFRFNSIIFNKIEIFPNAICRDGIGPLLAIHAGASKAYKRWPLENFVGLCRLLLDAGITPVLIGAGKHDEMASQAILDGLSGASGSAKTLNLCNQLDLRALAALLLKVDAVVGNDSGPSHLASALGTPGVVLFGPTEEQIWGPLGPHTCMLHKKSLCLPDCTRHHCQKDYACLVQVSPEEVFHKIIEIKKREGDLNVGN